MYNKQYLNAYQKRTYTQLNIKLNKTEEKDVIDLVTTLKEDGVPIRSIVINSLREFGKTYVSPVKE